MKFGIKRLKRLVALTAAALTLTSSVVALDLPAAEAATVGSGNCIATVDNTSGVVTYEAGIYCYVAFKSTGITYTWTKPVQVTTIDLLVVAGGGGGGARHAGGGGAGGLLQSTNNSLTASTMSITVGAGGAGAGAQSSGVTANGNIGNNSSVSASGFTTQLAYGGGFGGSSTGGGTGGSGGGGPCCSASGGSATAGQGNVGALGSTGTYNGNQFWVGGAGGGAGAAATAGTAAAQAGVGGAGAAVSWITTAAQSALGVGVTSGGSVYFAGGGGGGTAVYGSGGAGGIGGGGSGGTYNTLAAVAGTANTGGGGGGGGYNPDNTSPAGASGGSGVVVIRYLKAAPTVSFNASDINSYDTSVSATAVNDMSASGVNDGVATAQSSAALPGFETATGAWTFPGGATGVGPYINLPTSISSTPFSANGMTIDFEADFGSSVDSWERIADFSAGGQQNNNWEIGRYWNTNDLFFEIYNGSTSIGFCQYAGAIPANSGMNRWTITADGTNCKIYKNGTLVYTQANFTAKPTTGINWSSNYIGRSNWADASFEGKIRSFNLYAGVYAPTDFTGYTNKTITFDSFASGAATILQTRLTSGTIKLPAPTARPGYVFTGWFTSTAFTSLVGVAGATYTPSATTTLYGGWRTVDASVTSNLIMNWDGTNLASYPAAGTSASSIYPAPTTMNASGVTGTRDTANSPGALTLPASNAAVVNFGANNATNITGALTYETWVKFSSINTGASAWNVIASHWFADASGVGTASNDWHFGIYGAKLQVNAGASNIAVGSKTWTSADVGIWYHLGFSIDASNNLQIFINGRPDGAVKPNMAHAPNSTALMWIGDGRAGTVRMNGYVSRARLYNTALSATQIRSNFNLETPTFSQTQTFNLTYSAGPNGTGSDVVEFYNSGANATLRSATAPFTRNGYAITGWTTSNTSGAAQTNALSSALTMTGDVTLYPVWGSATNTITYNYNGATGGNGTASSSYTSGGTAITLPTPTKTGYTFGGWYLENTFATLVTGTQTPSSSYTIYAKWNAGTYTLTYNYNGATGGNGTATSSFTTGGTAITLPTPTKTGYTFGGWYSDAGLTTSVSGTQSPTADATLYAKWNNGTYTLTYNYNGATGGNGTASSSFTTGGTAITLPAPTKTGYTFGGWYSDAGLTTSVSGTQSPSADATLYAKWNAGTYTLTYNYNGATGANGTVSDSFTTGGTAITLPAPTKTGYTFGGWYSDAGLTTSVTGAQSPTASATLYAKWNAATFTLTYNYNGATGGNANASAGYTTGGTAITLPTPTKTGYTFGGWYSDAGLTTSVSGTQSPTADATLYAKWNNGTYTLTYSYNGATGGNGTVSDSFTTGGTAITLPAPTKTGYTFGGWYSDAGLTSAVTGAQSPTASATLYAKWNAATFTLTYNYNGATGGNANATASYTTGGTAITLPTPTKTGYTFIGWYSEANFTTAVTGTQTPSADANIYAKFTAINYGLTYNANGATGGAVPVDSSNYIIGSSASVAGNSGNLVRTGYTFAGWTLASNGTGTVYTSGQALVFGAAAQVLYAKWTANTYAIGYNVNGATGTQANASDSYTTGGSAVTLSAVGSMAKTGYTFAGWSTSANGSVLTGTYTTTADVTLYAIWTVNVITVTYSKGAAASASFISFPSNTSGNYATRITISNNIDSSVSFNSSTYAFVGWSDGTSLYQAGQQYLLGANNVTLTAIWVQAYGVRYIFNGGTPANGTSSIDAECLVVGNLCTDQQSVTANAAPTRDGYNFTGWVDQSANVIAAGSTFTVTINSYLLYAQWTAINYAITYVPNGGATTPTQSALHYGDTFTIANAITRTGYTFGGWSDGVSTYGAGATYTVGLSPITLTAVFTPKTYVITYDWNGGTGSAVANVNYTVGNAGATLATVGDHVKDGYQFGGWSLTVGGDAVASPFVATDNTTLYAIWGSGSYSVTFEQNYGVSTSSNISVANGTSTVLPTLTRNNFVFDGWYTAPVGGTKVGNGGASYTPSASRQLYAHWIQSSLYGIAPGNLSRVSTITASSSIDSTYSGTNGGSGVSVTVPRGSLPAGTVINLDMITDTSYAQSLVSGTNNYILALAVSWLALDETVPNTNGSTSISLTLTNSNIRAGALIYSVQNGVATLLGTATANGTLTVQLTADPGIYVVQTVPTVARTISSSTTSTSATITWTAPLSDGGATVTGYTVTLNNGMTCTTATLTCTFNNLTTGTSYTASIVATNSVGSSVAGTATFTPTAPVVAPPTPTPPTPQPPVPPTPQPPVDPTPSKPVVVVVPVVEAIAKVLANNVPVLNGTPVVSPIQFNADSAKLDATDLAGIKKAAAVLEGKSGVLLITGFVKYTGKASAVAKALAQARAKNVANALAKLGVKVKLGYVGYGPRNTANPANTDRKVELRWIAAPITNS